MKIDRVLIDTGPLVAVFRSDEQYHERCTSQLADIRPPLLTSWPVLTEAVYLLRKTPQAVKALLSQVEGGRLFRVVSLGDEFAPWVEAFFDRYSDREPQLADASLIYLAERDGIDTVFTLDRRDFSVYRLSGNRALNIVPPVG